MALTSIASCGEAACQKILNPSSSEKKVNGLMDFVAVVKEQSGDKQGMEEFVMLIDELLQEDSVKGSLFLQLLKYKLFFRSIKKVQAAEIRAQETVDKI